MDDEREVERRHRELLESQRLAADLVAQAQQDVAQETARVQQAAVAQINASQQSVAEQVARTKGLRQWLFDVIQNGDISEAFDRILKNGGSLDRMDDVGDTLLTVAVEENLLSPLASLLDRGASPSVRNKKGLTPLVVSALIGRAEAAKILLAHGAEADESCFDGPQEVPPIAWAVVNEHFDVMEVLLAMGAKPDVKVTPFGTTALQQACFRGFGKAVRRLLASGADPNVQDSNGSTAIMYANTPEILSMLIEHHADLKHRSRDGQGALHSASMKDNCALALMLLEHGLDPNLGDVYGKTPIKMTSSDEMKSLLKQHGAKGCFIATAVCDPSDPSLVMLRRFRDERLDTSVMGRLVVRVYYFVSPPAARWLQRHDFAKKFVRDRVIRPFAGWVKT